MPDGRQGGLGTVAPRAGADRATRHLASFAQALRWADVPSDVRRQTRLALLDVLGAAVAGTRLPVAEIVQQAAPRVWGGDEASVILSGRRASAPGAAFANATLANALDIDDGYRPVKGHPGAVVVPAALAVAESRGSGAEAFLAAVLAGYEAAMRAGLACHAVYADCHGSGSWGALGAAVAAGVLLGLPVDSLAQALGIAEYHGALSPIMRCVEHPGMVKDGIGWGAAAGVTAAILAAGGFTGIPTVFDVRPEVLEDLGREYKVQRLYFKPHPCCRWAQPAVAAVERITAEGAVDPAAIASVRIRTFDAALRLGPVHPETTEEAQYSLAWPVAAAIVDGRLGPEQVAAPRLRDPRIRALAGRVEGSLSAELDARFPAEALCEVEIVLRNGEVRRSGTCGARGEPSNPLSEAELRRKFHALADPVLGAERAGGIARAVDDLGAEDGLPELLALLR